MSSEVTGTRYSGRSICHLPPEIRQQIYEEYIMDEFGLRALTRSGLRPYTHIAIDRMRAPAMAQANSQLRSEVLATLFTNCLWAFVTVPPQVPALMREDEHPWEYNLCGSEGKPAPSNAWLDSLMCYPDLRPFFPRIKSQVAAISKFAILWAILNITLPLSHLSERQIEVEFLLKDDWSKVVQSVDFARSSGMATAVEHAMTVLATALEADGQGKETISWTLVSKLLTCLKGTTFGVEKTHGSEPRKLCSWLGTITLSSDGRATITRTVLRDH